ncbi:MAG: 50S ribosomal protein L11 methyltransferase, partial [Bacteroidales bacterium]
MSTFEFEFPVRSWNSSEREILLARLFLIGFEGFEEGDDILKAYIPRERYSSEDMTTLAEQMSEQGLRVQYRYHETPVQNWNEEWEKSFDPVVIDEKVLIRAPFHAPDRDLPLTLVIEPKMSFGTGHHITTKLMIRDMLELSFEGARVLDMGSGTGVLGILAVRLGASRVLGVD